MQIPPPMMKTHHNLASWGGLILATSTSAVAHALYE
jgi:hypothetical protein